MDLPVHQPRHQRVAGQVDHTVIGAAGTIAGLHRDDFGATDNDADLLGHAAGLTVNQSPGMNDHIGAGRRNSKTGDDPDNTTHNQTHPTLPEKIESQTTVCGRRISSRQPCPQDRNRETPN